MTGALMRERVAGRHAQVTFVELLFDLVFVFAVTQVSHGLLAHLSPLGALQGALLVMSVWWAWIFTAWPTNWLDPEHPTVRLMLFALMAAGLLMSTSISQAFEARGLAFAAAYVAFQVGRTLFMIWAVRAQPVVQRTFQRIAVWFAASAVLWIAGGLADGPARLGLWAAALAIEYASAALGFWTPGLGRAHTQDWNVEGTHIAERCGLFVIICLGESILVTGATLSGLDWTAPVIAAFGAALVGSLAMWWIYFSAHAHAASEAIASSDDPGRIARFAYTYLHLFIVAGVIVSAAGDELILAHPEGHAEPAMIATVLGGAALFLLGSLFFKASVFGVWAAPRLTGLALLAALAPASHLMSPLGLAWAVAGVLAFVGGWESVLRMRRERAERSAVA